MAIALAALSQHSNAQIAAWNFTGLSNSVTVTSTNYNANLSSAPVLSRGPGAPANTAGNSFRTTGFQNNGISTANTDYFQTILSAASGFKFSLTSISAYLAGTTSYAASPGTTNQLAYSLDGTNFTLIEPAAVRVGSGAIAPIDTSAIGALQNVPAGTTVTLRFYATGQTSTGGWGFNSPNATTDGFLLAGVVEPSAGNPPIISSFSPLIGPVGTTITINGFNFGASPTVKFNGVAAISPSVNPAGTIITATVPAGATTGLITVEVTGLTTATSATDFVVVPPGEPIISLSTNEIAGLNVAAGSYSAVTNYTVTGFNLGTNPVVVTPDSALVELGTNGTDFSGTLSLPATGGAVSSVVYLRLAATNAVANSYSANVDHVSGTASSSLLVYGSITNPAPSLVMNPTNLTGFSTSTGAPSEPQTFSVTGSNLTSDVTVSATVGFEVAPDGATWGTNALLLQSGGTLSNTVSVRLAATNVWGFRSGNVFLVTPDFTPTRRVAVSGTVAGTPPDGLVFWDFNSATPTYGTNGAYATWTFGPVTQGNNNGTTAIFTASSVSSGYTNPFNMLASGTTNAGAAARTGALVAGTNGSAYFETQITLPGNASASITNISFGSRATSTGPAAYAIRSGADNFTSDIATGSLTTDSTWIMYVAPVSLPLANGTNTIRIYGYNGAGAASASSANWRIDDLGLALASAGPTISISTNTISGLTATQGSPGAVTNFTASGANLVDDIAVSVPGSDFIVSTNPSGGFTNSFVLTRSGAGVASTPIYVRLTGTNIGTFTNTVSLASSNATTQNVTVIGTVDALPVPSISATPSTITNLGTTAGTPSDAQSFTASGTLLSDNITVSANDAINFAVSTNATNGFASSLVLSTNGSGAVPSTPVYVRLTGTNVGSFTNTVALVSGALSTNVTVGGIVASTNDPFVDVDPVSLSGFTAFLGSVSTNQTVGVSGANLTGPVQIDAPSGFEVSTNGTTFGSSITIPVSGGTLTFTSSTNWVVPMGVSFVQVECWGAGGAGGSALRSTTTVSRNYAGGGAGGAYAKVTNLPVTAGSNYSVNVGVGLSNSSNVVLSTVNGGDSWFGSATPAATNVLAKGGQGAPSIIGDLNNGTVPTRFGAGGVGNASGSFGDVVLAGGSGSAGSETNIAGTGGGGGGGSSAGTFLAGVAATSVAGATAPSGGGNGGSGAIGSTNGTNGVVPGGGGGGAATTSITTLRSGGAGGNGQVFITAAPFFPLTTVYVRIASTATLGANSGNLTITSAGAPTRTVSLSGAVSPVPGPAVTATPSSLSGFTTSVGAPSTAQTFNASGSNLSANITITAPTGYAVSTNGTTFTTSVTLTPSSGTVASTSISVRLTGASAGSPSGNVTVASSGATTQNVAVSGTVNTPTVTASPASLSGFSTTLGAPSAAQTFNAGGTNLSGNIAITAPTGYQVALTNTNAAFTTSVSLTPGSGTVASTPVFVRLSGASAGSPSGNVTVASIGATTQNVAVSGTVVAPIVTATPSSLAGFSTTVGTPSPSQSFNAGGSNLTNNISITPPGGYEVSLSSASGYASSLTLTQSGGTVASTQVFVRLTGASLGSPSGNVAVASGGAATQNVAVSGTVNPSAPAQITPTPSSITNLAAFSSVPGAPQTVVVAGQSLTSNITAGVGSGFELSAAAGGPFVASTNLPVGGGNLYVRLAPSNAVGPASGTLALSSGSTSTNVPLSGTRISGTTNITPGLTTFGGDLTLGAASQFDFALITNSTNARGTNFSAVNVISNLVISAGATFNVILNGTNSATDFTDPFWNSARSWPVFNVGGTITGNFVLGAVSPDSKGNTPTGTFGLSNGAGVVYLTWTAAQLPQPALTASTNALALPTTGQGTPSGSLGFNVTSINLTNGITVAAGDAVNFAVSTNNTDFSGSVLLPSSGGAVWVRLTGANTNTFSNTVTISAVGAAPVAVGVSGTVVGAGVPILSPTNNTTLSGFSTTRPSPSASQSFELSGSNLSNNVVITPPAGWEVSGTNTNNWSSSALTIATNPAGVVSNTPIHVRLVATNVGSYSNILPLGVAGSLTNNVLLLGTVSDPVPVITRNPTNLTGFTALRGNPSTNQSFNLSGSNLTTNITVGPLEGWQVSLTGNSNEFSSSLVVTNNPADTLTNTFVYVRLAGTNTNTSVNAPLPLTSGTASNNVLLSGAVTNAPVAVSVSTNGPLVFSTLTNQASAPQSFTAGGANLSNNITVTAPTNFSIAFASNSVDFTNTLTLTNTTGTATNREIFVRLNAVFPATNIAATNIVLATTGGSNFVTVSGAVTNSPPSLTATPASLTNFLAVTGSSSNEVKSYTLSGSNIFTNVTVTAPTNFQVALTNTNTAFSNTVAPVATNGILSTNIFVRASPAAATNTNLTGTITNTSGTATTNVTLQARVVLAPTLSALPTTLSNFSTITGIASTNQNFNLTASNLLGPVSLSVTNGYEISTSASNGFSTSLSVGLVSASDTASNYSTNTAITYVGSEAGAAVQNWSDPNVAKTYGTGGSQVYGTAGYYQIRPVTPTNSVNQISTNAVAGNDLGISATNYPTAASAPLFVSSIAGGAGTFVNFTAYPNFRATNGSGFVRQGALSVSVNNGPNNSPAGTNASYYGVPFEFTTASAGSFRLGLVVDAVADAAYSPNYVSLYSSSAGTVFSGALVRDGKPDIVFFDVTAKAGQTFTVGLWQNAGTQSVAALSMVTFDALPGRPAGWTNGANGGTGFGPWAITVDSGTGFAGAFIGNPAAAGIVTDSTFGTNAFGMYANPTGSGAYATADRTFPALLVGQTFSFQWAVNYDADTGNKGFNLYAGGAGAAQLVNLNQGGFPGNITLNGANAITNYGTNAMTWSFTMTSATNLLVTSTARDGTTNIAFTTNIAVSAPPDALRWYVSGMSPGDQRQPYFNNLQIAYAGGNITNLPVYVRLATNAPVAEPPTNLVSRVTITTTNALSNAVVNLTGNVFDRPSVAVSTNTIGGLITTNGYFSAPTNFAVTGRNLSNNVTLTVAPTNDSNFQISTNGLVWTNLLSFAPDTNRAVSNAVQVRITALAPVTNNLTGLVEVLTTGAASGTNVSLTGIVLPDTNIPTVMASTYALSGLGSVEGSPGPSTNLTVSGSFLRGPITVYAANAFLALSTNNLDFGTNVSLARDFDNTVPPTPVYVRITEFAPVSTNTNVFLGNLVLATTRNSNNLPAPTNIAVSGTVTNWPIANPYGIRVTNPVDFVATSATNFTFRGQIGTALSGSLLSWLNLSSGASNTFAGAGGWTWSAAVPLVEGYNTVVFAGQYLTSGGTTNIASDAAGDSAYALPGGWVDGDNGGYGFAPWQLYAEEGLSALYRTDTWVSTNMNVSAFNGFAVEAIIGGVANAYRPFDAPVQAPGGAFTVQFDSNDLQPGGTVGMALVASNRSPVFTFAVVNNGSGPAYQISDAAASPYAPAGWTYNASGMQLRFEMTSSNGYMLTAAGGSFTNTATGSVSGVPIAGVVFFSDSAGPAPGNNFYFGAMQQFSTIYELASVSTVAPDVERTTAPTSAYDTWAEGYGLDPAGNGAPGADPDVDGFNNDMEFAFGTNPTRADVSLLTVEQSGGNMVVTFVARDSGVAYAVMQKANLAASVPTWANTGIVTGIDPDQAGVPVNYRRRTFSVPANGQDFYRVRASISQ